MNYDMNDELQVLRDEGKSKDEILAFLFKKGLLITDAIIAIRALYGMELQEAKRIVSQSRHWEDIHKTNRHLHDALEVVAKQFPKD